MLLEEQKLTEFLRDKNFETIKEVADYLKYETKAGRLTEDLATKNFSYFLRKGVQATMVKGYDLYPAIYLRGNITTQKTTEADPETYVQAGMPTGVEIVHEGAEFPAKGLAEEHVTIKHTKKGIATRITYEMIKLDRTNQIITRAQDLGAAHRIYENQTVADFYNNGTANTGFDGVATFKDTGHPDTTGGSAVSTNTNDGSLGGLSGANLRTAKQEIALWRGLEGEYISINPIALAVSSSQLPIAQELIYSPARVDATYSSGVKNIHAGTLEVIHFPNLTAGTWYVLCSPIEGLIMSWIDKLTLEKEQVNTGEGFWNQSFGFRAHTWWGLDCVNWRWAYRGD